MVTFPCTQKRQTDNSGKIVATLRTGKIESTKPLKNTKPYTLPPATPDSAALAERGLPPIPFAAQGLAIPEVSVFGARRLLTPAACWGASQDCTTQTTDAL